MEYNKNIDERKKKILQTIIKHCNIILETKIYFGDEYEKKELLSIFFQKNYVTLHIFDK